MFSNINEKDIEFALQMLNSPDREGESDFREWIREPGHRELFRDLLAIREAGMAEFGVSSVDVDRMWRQFGRKRSRTVYRKVQRWVASAAAVLMLGSGIYGLLRMQGPESSRTLVPVEYHLGKGVTLLSGETLRRPEERTMPEVKDIPGVKTFIRDSLRGISYSEMVTVKNGPVKYHTLRVPRAADYMVVLEDSTCVWVNAESELRYPVRFGKGERTVELRGEAYFKVRPDASRPFIVRTDRAETRVLGTEFNMQAYPGQLLNVTLVEGRVKVKAIAREVVLRPGENAALTAGGLKVETVDVLKYISWKNGYFYYDDVCLEEILAELGRWYDFTVRYENEALKSLRFKFWAGRYEPLEQMLAHLNEMHKAKVTKVGSCICITDYQKE